MDDMRIETLNRQSMVKRIYPALGMMAMFVAAAAQPTLADSDGVYSMFDRDLDGYVDRAEFQQLLKKRRIKPAYKHLWTFDDIDLNRDEKIAEQEMVEVLQKEMKLRKALRRSKP
jgi:hypothetical protein